MHKVVLMTVMSHVKKEPFSGLVSEFSIWVGENSPKEHPSAAATHVSGCVAGIMECRERLLKQQSLLRIHQ